MTTLSPFLITEIRLFLYIFSSKFIDLWETPFFMKNLWINTDLLVFKRMDFESFLTESQKLFTNLLILEDQELNDCQFKKYFSRFSNLLLQTYQTNNKLSYNQEIRNQYAEFSLFLTSIKSAFLEPKRFETYLDHISFDSTNQDIHKIIMTFFKLGENYFTYSKQDFTFLGIDFICSN